MKKTDDTTLKGKFNSLITALDKEEKEAKTPEVKNFWYTAKENIKLWMVKIDALTKALEEEKKR